MTPVHNMVVATDFSTGAAAEVDRAVRAPYCPVLMVRCGPARPDATLLAAVDLSAQAKREAIVAMDLFTAA